MKTSNKGITLVILVIIIIVMSILATTAIITITDSNIIGFANTTVNENNINNIREAAEIAYNSLLIENMGDTASISEDLIKQKIIQSGINESDLQGLSFELGETLRVGYKQVINNSATINNNMSGRLSFKILGNSVQNGKPSPSTPVKIQSVGDNTKNFFNVNIIANSYCTVENNSLKVNIITGNSSSGTGKTLKELCPNLEVGKTYTLSYTTDSTTDNNMSIGSYATANFWINGQKRTITAEDLAATVRFGNTGSTARTVTFSNIQIEEGSTATTYEPYGYKIPITVTNNNETKTYNIYLDEPLRKIGEYEDYIDFSSKTLYRIIGTKATNFKFHNYLENSNVLYLKNTTVFSDKNPNIIAGLSNKILKFTTFPGSVDNNKLMMNGNMYYYCVAATEDEKQTYIDLLENTEIYYVLNELSSSKIELPEIYTTSGNTTITIDTETNPSEIELFYQYN